MKNILNDRKKIAIIGLVVIICILLIIIGALVIKNDFNKSLMTKSENTTKKVKKPSIESKIEENKETSKPVVDSNDITTSNNNVSENVRTNDNNYDDINSRASNEGEVINYIQGLNDDFSTYNNQNDPSLKEKAKNSFTTVVDFMFYDKPIKGYTFKELTLKAKLNAIKLAMAIDNKIDRYFPNYKDSIKSGIGSVKGKLAVLYLETCNKLCESVGETACQQARNDFAVMKNNFGLTFAVIKNSVSEGGSKLKTIISEWYASIK